MLRENHLRAIAGRWVMILDFQPLSLACDFEAFYLGENARAFWND